MHEILNIISKEGPLPTAEIATRLNMSPEDVEQALEEDSANHRLAVTP